MSLRRKLGRLDETLARRRAPAADPAATDRQRTLDSLRSKMADILGREPPAPRPPADPVATELPFVRVTTPVGLITQRLETLAASHHVGRMPADAAVAASAEMLALLALDPELAGADPAGALYVDTETTGLGSGAGTVAFLVGLAFFDEERRLIVEQLLLKTPSEEEAMLRHLAQRIERASMLVSYNGKTFDLPVLQARFVMNRLALPPERPHLDLLHIARRLHRARIKQCNLKRVESEVLGFVRDTDIDGGEVAPRYGHFLRTGDEGALTAVVEHNAWDVVSMAAIVALYGEPLTALHRDDLVSLARTFKRARALDRAGEAAERALAQGGGADARRIRGQIAKARGDRAQALSDFEQLSSEVDDDEVRLELAKLYEHHVKEPLKALEMVDRGTGETEEAVLRRRTRLERKARKKGAR